jgi:hypothetical protein
VAHLVYRHLVRPACRGVIDLVYREVIDLAYWEVAGLAYLQVVPIELDSIQSPQL